MHDQNFKKLILDYPRQALAFFAAEEAGEDLANARIVPIRQEQLQERLGERFRELDVPLLVEWPDGRREAILFVIEEETATSRFSIHRLAHYCLDLAELFETDRIVPVVIFLRPGARPDRLQLGGDRHAHLDFRYLSCELHRLAAAPQAGLATLESEPEKPSKYADLTDEELAYYRDTTLQQRGDLMGLAQQLRQEGRMEGRQEGRKEGEAYLLRRQFTLRFGPLPDWADQQLSLATTEQLESWALLVLDADNLDSVLRS